MKRLFVLFIALSMLLSAACSKPSGEDAQVSLSPSPSAEPTAEAATPEPTPGPTAEPTADPTPEPTPEPDASADALLIAEQHGLTEDDLRGEYGLFLHFAEVVDNNRNLGGFDDFVYMLFPIIADNADIMDEDYFFARLRRLVITAAELDNGNSGEYHDWDTSVTLNTAAYADAPHKAACTLIHELMHFLDFTLCGPVESSYFVDGRYCTAEEFFALDPKSYDHYLYCRDANIVTEGGAEYFSAKYYSGAIGSYSKNCSFLAGLEYIYGEEALRKLFFGADSDGEFAIMLFDAGYSESKYLNACETLNWLSRPGVYSEPGTYVAPEDILIDLYEAKLGSGWQEDEGFIYILKTLNGIALTDYQSSEHADFLRTVLFTKWSQYNAFEAELLSAVPFDISLLITPPAFFMRGGKQMIGTYASWTDPDTGENITGTVCFEYDFDAQRPIGFELKDTGALFDVYFR